MPNKSLIALAVGACAALPFATAQAQSNADCIEIGLTGGWFSVFGTSRDYAVPVTVATGINSGSVNTTEPKYRFGGGVSLAYQPCGQPYIWNLSWFGVQKKRVTDTSGPVSLGLPFEAISAGDITANSASVSEGTRYNFWTATLATLQGLCCDTVHVRPHLGVAYLDTKVDRTLTATGVIAGVAAVPGILTVTDNSRFHGFGPDVGVDLKYCFCGGFSLYGNLDYAALIGKNKGSFSGFGDSFSWSTSRANHVVSHIQTEIAIGYNFGFCGCDRGDLLLGYRVTKMIDAFARGVTSPITYHNGNLHGPFLRLNWGFSL